jgi:hypothetical protein
MMKSVLVNVGGGKVPTFGCRKRYSRQDRIEEREDGEICLYATDGAVTLGYDSDQRPAQSMSRVSISSAE